MKKYRVNVNGVDYEIALEALKDGEDFAPKAAAPAAAPAAPAAATAACTACGQPIAAGSKFCPSCGAKQEEKPAGGFCPNCGGKVEAGSKFCPNCGNKMA